MQISVPFFRGLIDVSASTFTDGMFAKWDDTAKRLVGASAITTGLANLEALASLGLIVQTATDTWAARSVVGTSNRVTVANGDGVSGNPTIDIAATYVGQASITTLGTITTGTWHGTAIAVAYGGTGLTATPANGEIPIGNGTGYTLATPTGTANQVIVTTGAGSITLSLPQSIHSAATPTFATLTLTSAPTADSHAATKAYVDSLSQGLDFKPSCRVATTANITLSGTQTIDGVAVIVGDRVLVKNQSTASQNGIYVVASGAWSRAADSDTSAEVTSGLYVFISEGTSNASSGWVLTTPDPITLGTTSLTFTQFSGAGQITAGNGLNKTGNTLSVVAAPGGGLSVSGSGVAIDATWTGQTSITTVGTITTGTWQGTPIAVAYGGTGVATASANTVFAGPTSGGSAAPAFRALVAGDIPNLDAAKITTGTFNAARLPTHSHSAADITSGTLSTARGGTGLSATPANGQLPIGNGTDFTLANLTAGTGISVTNSAGGITIASSIPTGPNAAIYRLSSTSGTPYPTSDVSSTGSLYLVPLGGSTFSVFNTGTATWDHLAIANTSITVPTGSSGDVYDVFAYNNSGNLAFETTVWTNANTRASALAMVHGVWVKSSDNSRRYIGTFRLNGTNTTCDTAQKRFIFSYYGRVNKHLYSEETGASHNYSTATWREWNNSTSYRIEYVLGVLEDSPIASLYGGVSGTADPRIAFGFNSSSSPSPGNGLYGVGVTTCLSMSRSLRIGVEAVLGYNYVTAVQYTGGGTGTFDKLQITGSIRG